MCEDSADVLREAIDDERTVSDAWQDQQTVNESITASSTDILRRICIDESRVDEVPDVVTEFVDGRFERPDV